MENSVVDHPHAVRVVLLDKKKVAAVRKSLSEIRRFNVSEVLSLHVWPSIDSLNLAFGFEPTQYYLTEAGDSAEDDEDDSGEEEVVKGLKVFKPTMVQCRVLAAIHPYNGGHGDVFRLNQDSKKILEVLAGKNPRIHYDGTNVRSYLKMENDDDQWLTLTDKFPDRHVLSAEGRFSIASYTEKIIILKNDFTTFIKTSNKDGSIPTIKVGTFEVPVAKDMVIGSPNVLTVAAKRLHNIVQVLLVAEYPTTIHYVEYRYFEWE